MENNIFYIPLASGKSVIIDLDDYILVMNYKWWESKNKNLSYAYANDKDRNYISMHRLLLGLTKGDGIKIDHINGNGLDNRKENLRFCTRSQNNMNRKKARGVSKYKGVCRYESRDKWVAVVKVNGAAHNLGYFEREIDAAKAYNRGALKYHGEFAKLNEV